MGKQMGLFFSFPRFGEADKSLNKVVLIVSDRARIKIGITANAEADTHHTLWANGLGQNIAYLALLLQRLDIVDSVYIISCPDSESHPIAKIFGLHTITMDYAVANLDIVVEMGIRAAQPHQIEALRKRGGKTVTYIAGNTMVMNLEGLASRTEFTDWVNPLGWDAAWVTPQHWHTNRAYITLTRSKNTSIAPHIWDPICLNQSGYEIGRNLFYKTPEAKSWSLGCFDPNVNVVKTFHLPLLAAENAYRKSPELIENITLFCAKKLENTAHYRELVSSLQLGQDNKIIAESRYRLLDMIGKRVNAVVAHQWQNNLNYVYWEVLYLGWPLIHNSTEFADVGYYFPEFDPKKGGEIMCEGLENHDELRVKQADAIRQTLWRFSIENPQVQAKYSELIEEVLG